MGKKLAQAAAEFFSKAGIEGEHSGGVVKYTVSPMELEERLKDDPIWQAMKKIDEQMIACMQCSDKAEAGYFMVPGNTQRIKGICIVRNFKNADGSCVHCGHINSADDSAALDGRRQKMKAACKDFF